MQVPSVLLVATGGTISGRHGSDGTYSATSGAADLLAGVEPAAAEGVRAIDFSRKLSFEVTLDEWLELAARLRGWMADPSIGAVLVVQGTALMEEVPFLVSLFVESTKPIVFTGAMIAGDRPDSDAARNLADALAVCRDPAAAGYGPLVVMGGFAIAARTVRKAHRHDAAAIRSTETPVAQVGRQGVRWTANPPASAPVFGSVGLAAGVPLLKVVLGIEPALVDAILATHLAGLVVEGFPGGGGLPPFLAARLAPLAARIPVVLGSRAPEGDIGGSSAGGRSGGGALLRDGLISSGNLMSEKARLLLMAALANLPADADAIGYARTVFETFTRPASVAR